MKHTISVLVENRPGVLARITGLFARRGFNIDSLSVSATEDNTASRITITAEGAETTVEQIEKQLNKLIDVIKVKRLESETLVARELMLIKLTAPAPKRGEIDELARLVGAEIAELTRDAMTLSLTDTSERLDRLVELARPYGIRELVRTGVVALERGSKL